MLQSQMSKTPPAWTWHCFEFLFSVIRACFVLRVSDFGFSVLPARPSPSANNLRGRRRNWGLVIQGAMLHFFNRLLGLSFVRFRRLTDPAGQSPIRRVAKNGDPGCGSGFSSRCTSGYMGSKNHGAQTVPRSLRYALSPRQAMREHRRRGHVCRPRHRNDQSRGRG